MKGLFVISLDFELHWGGFEKWALEEQDTRHKTQDIRHKTQDVRHKTQDTRHKTQYFLNTRKVIPEILKAFEAHEVCATWATVGLLFHDERSPLYLHAPALKPSYINKALSAYHYMEVQGIGENEDEDPFHYALSLIKQIQQTPGQEIGSHTFAHYYCNEAGQNTEQFRADLRAAQKSAHVQGVDLKSLVFPRNQFTEAYLKVCYEEGITSVRSNPKDWFWTIDTPDAESKWLRLNRGLDAYFPVGKKSSYRLAAIEKKEGLPLCIPASRLLRPYHPKEGILNKLKIRRVLKEMEYAAQHGELYHLWWHPHNFGGYPKESMEGLNTILKGYQKMKEKFGMESLHMQGVGDLRLKI